MEVFLNVFIQCISEIVALVIISLLGVLSAWLLNKLKQKKGLENITIATEQVISASQKTVLELQQTLVEGWKRAQDGKLTEEQVNELKQKVLEITLAKLADPTVKLLEGAKVDVLTMITSAAESYILEMKKKKSGV